MRIGAEPVWVTPDDGDGSVNLVVDGGSSVNLALSRTAASFATVAVGATQSVTTGCWAISTGAYSDVHFEPTAAVAVLGGGNPDSPRYDRLKSAYVASDSCGLNLRKAINRARNGGAPARFTCRGDSTTYAVLSGTNPGGLARRDITYHARARQILNAGSLLPGLVEESITQMAAADDSRFTYGGGAAAGVLASGQTMTFAEVAGGHDRFDVVVLKQANAASITANPDGAGAQVLTLAGANNTVQRFTVTATGTGAHSIVFTGPAAGSATIIGIEPWSSASPPILWLGGYGVSGQTLSGVNPGSTGVGQNMFPLLQMKPDGHFLLMGINDMRNTADLRAGAAAYGSNVAAYVAAFQAQSTDVFAGIFPSYNSNQSGVPSADESVLFHRALYDQVDAFGLAALDIQRRWGYGVAPTTGYASTPVTNSAMYDGTHPTLLGYWDIGRMLARFIADLCA